MTINIFIQARMSSTRFPGKMLAPLRGKPIMAHVIERCRAVSGIENVVVVTSDDVSDDVLANYLESIQCPYIRGSLENVFGRFQSACKAYPCDYFIRISGDSPLIEPALIADMVTQAETGKFDFLSNVWHKKFPKGQSVEIIRTSVFCNVNGGVLTPDEIEHVMPYFYAQQARYKTFFMDSAVNNRHINCCVDTPSDLERLETRTIQYSYNAKESQCSAT